MNYFKLLRTKVIDRGLCTHCGTCVGLYPDNLIQKETENGPLPYIKKGTIKEKTLLESCPGYGVKYNILNNFVFGKNKTDFVLGDLMKGYIGYSKDNMIRENSASGGIITSTLLYLLDNKLIDGAIVLKQGVPKPWLAKPIIATTKAEIVAASQSVYVPVMVNAILNEVKKFEGNLAFVGLPDQVASIRYLQSINNKESLKIKYIIGPYCGTIMYAESIASFLRSNGVKKLEDIKYMKYRDGEWPGYLRIDTKDGKKLKCEKFYYNYLIPFFITRSSLWSIDFSNELTDISVGDAWHPKYEQIGKGFSVVLARSKNGLSILEEMKKKRLISLEQKGYTGLVNMHGHMIDFKKRGAFIRMKMLKIFGKSIPNYDYRPANIGFSRYIVEVVISGLFLIGKIPLSKKIVELIPQKVIGTFFNFLRLNWKRISKSAKRKGLGNIKFTIEND